MRTTRIVSLSLPWTDVAQEAVSAKFLCQVDIFKRDPYVLVVHADIEAKDLVGVIPEGVPIRIDHSNVLPFQKPAAK